MKSFNPGNILVIVILFGLLSFNTRNSFAQEKNSLLKDDKKVLVTDSDRQRAKDLVSQMTLEEKLSYLAGETPFSLRPIERLGIPRILLADGPQGIRNHCDHSTLYPSGIAAASTWNRDLLYNYGESLGNDSRARGVGILLGPGVNIYRYPLCGRNFEYMGEDPYLASEMACNYIEGVQSKGVIATIKHFAGNNQEWNRHHASSDIDERTLQEIYFPTFRKAIEKAGVGAVMNSYNLLNGLHSTENYWLNTEILRDMWGFEGILMSDWNSVYSTVNAANSGLDLEMPGPLFFTEELLKEALNNGRISINTIDEKIIHLLQTFRAFGLLDRNQPDSSIPLDSKDSRRVALQTAREGVVLLKNEDNILPLKGKTLVLGSLSDTIVSGGGSGAVNAFSVTPLTKAMKNLDPKTITISDKELYKDLSSCFYTDNRHKTRGFHAQYFNNIDLDGKPARERTDSILNFYYGEGSPDPKIPNDGFSARWTSYFNSPEDCNLRIALGGDDGYRLIINGSIIADDWDKHAYRQKVVSYPVKKDVDYKFVVEYFEGDGRAQVDMTAKAINKKLLLPLLSEVDNVVINTGFTSDLESEGFDRPFNLPQYEEAFINEIASYNPNVVVVVNSGGAVDLRPWINSVKGLIMAWYPGQEGGTAIAEILKGDISPSGKLPFTYYGSLEDSPVHSNYYPNRINVNNSNIQENDHIEYREGITLGYRGNSKYGAKPMYPFGYGLTYSDFDFSNLSVSEDKDDSVNVKFYIKNVGDRKASEVVQVYVKDLESNIAQPDLALKGFEKITLKPGERKEINITLNRDAFSYYDVDSHSFKIEPGEFQILVGNSSENLPLSQTITINK